MEKVHQEIWRKFSNDDSRNIEEINNIKEGGKFSLLFCVMWQECFTGVKTMELDALAEINKRSWWQTVF